MTYFPSTFRALTDGWTLTAVDGPLPQGFTREPIPAVVPGEVHTDLLRAALIDAPFDGDNEAAQQWIGDTVWRYRTVFDWADDGSERHDLVAYGLDTVATVALNGTVVANTQNQHRSYRWDVREQLVAGSNELVITFAAPVPEALRRVQEFGPLPRVNHHEYNQLRKMACSYGWDWGIDVAAAGIWKPIGIDSWSGLRIASVRPLVDVQGSQGVLTAHVEIERADAASTAETAVTVKLANLALGHGATVVGTVAAAATGAVVEARIPDAALWWPIGYGEQPLYDVSVSAGDDEWAGRVGFRTVAVDTASDADGNPFTLYVNGRRVLVRGVNWIPDHAFLTEIDKDRYARRLTDATEANVNLVRIWGGGIYESDDFYDLADERGILVWQDFLLACAAYAEEEHMAVEIEAEAREQITRLSAHASLVIWNGNNENIWGWADWGWRDKVGSIEEGRGTWGNGYYRTLFPQLIAELDPSRFYSPASPFSFGEYLHPNDERNGTMHIWDVWNRRDYSVYREYKPRFVSEFGFQGPPAWSTLVDVVHDEPLDPYGHEMLVHQKANLGNKKLERGYTGHLPAPKTIEDWHWTTQLNQAHAVRFGVEHFRSLTPLNTGTILWQLNDNWPVVSWAAVDFDEHRKPLWYALRDAYAPRLATIQPRSSQKALDEAFEGYAPEIDTTALVLVNDTDAAYEGAFAVSRTMLDGEVLASATLEVSVPARGAATFTLPEDLAVFGDASSEIVVAAASDGASGFAQAILNGAELMDQRLRTDALTATAAKTEGGYTITVTAGSLLRDVFVNADRVDRRASVDRGLVTLLAGQSASFAIASAADVEPEAFLDALVLRSANDLLA